MSERKRRILTPHYMQSFKCIGSSCEDSCCVGWKVEIDSETYKKYRKIRDEELSILLDKYVNRNRSNPDIRKYAKIKLIEDEKCPFLSEKMLCRIQIKRGEDYLSDVCTTYPRVSNMINNVLERSATMSCPEAARLALLNPQEMEFDEDEESITIRNIILNNFNTYDGSLRNKPQKYLWELRIFSINILQNRSYALWERLFILGLFFEKVQKHVDTNMIDQIPELILAYTDYINNGSFREGLSSISTLYTIQMELLKEAIGVRYDMGVASKRFFECTSEFMNGIGYTDETKAEELGQRYNEAYINYYEPFMKEHEYILENYLVDNIFKTLFPFSGEKSLFDAYMMLVLHYALIKMHLIGISAYHKGLTVEHVIKLIQSFAKGVEHNKEYPMYIADLMRKNNYNRMAYMSILIKN